MSESTVTRAEYVVLACAEIFSGAGEIMASPMSTSSTIGARLARLTTEPDLLITDGEASFSRTLRPSEQRAPSKDGCLSARCSTSSLPAAVT